MKAVRYYGFGGPVQIDEIEAPVSGPTDVIVRTKACQIGGDITKVMAGTGPVRNRDSFAFPHVPGMRGSGVVERLGSEVEGLTPGDRVTINGCINCGACDFCRQGLGNLCVNGYLLGVDTGKPGTFADLVKVPAWAVFRLSDTISFGESNLFANMALMVHAFERARPQPGFTVALLGCGAVGACTIAVAKAYGATRIIAIDREPGALKFAGEVGATDLVNAASDDPVKAVMDLTDGRGADVAVELVGIAETVEQTIRCTKRRGTALLVGVLGGVSLSFPEPDYYNDVIWREIDVKPCYSKTQRDFGTAVRLEAAGLLDLSAFSVAAHPVKAFVDAVATAKVPVPGTINVVDFEL
jgi:threonine dehydrogenase-like Zn-dependent dehydrogenase